MATAWKSGCTLGVLSWAWLLAGAAPARGEYIPPVKIDAGVNAWFKIYSPSKLHMKNLPPWYTYFPVDPAMAGPGTPYPNWPSPFPPPQPSQQQRMPPAYDLMPPAGNGGAFQTLPRSSQTAAAWPIQPVVPAAYVPAPPNYWFAR